MAGEPHPPEPPAMPTIPTGDDYVPPDDGPPAGLPPSLTADGRYVPVRKLGEGGMGPRTSSATPSWTGRRWPR
jgi:hypothetical protein